MKFKTTILLMAVFVALLAFVLFYESKTQGKKETEDKLVDLPSADVQKMSLKNEDGTLAFQRDDKGDWLITQPLEAKGDSYEVNRLAEDFSSLRIERVVEPTGGDPSKYEIPKKELTLWYKDRADPVKLLIGMENPLDKALFAKKDGDERIVLIPSHLKSTLDKKTFDFRQKDIFKFEVEEVTGLKLKAKEIAWDAHKKEDDWFFQKPLIALAEKSRIEDVLRALSNLKAKEFVSEQKQPDEMKTIGLQDPEYIVSLAFPSKNQEVTFSLHKQDDKVYATTSLSSKVILSENQVLTDIEKKIEELREKQVVVFSSWEAEKLALKRGNLTLTLEKSKEKDDSEKWVFSGSREEADQSTIETFIRKIESLEAVEFIDSPGDLEAHGLVSPQAEVTIWTKEGEKELLSRVLVGKEDPEKKQVVVKNSNLDYLFRVDSSFLADFPKEAKDWKPAPPEEKKGEAKEEKKE